MKKVFLIFSLFLFIFSCTKDEPTKPKATEEPITLSPLHTEGRWIINAKGDTVILRGVNIPGLEWDASGDHMIESVNEAIDNWKCNILRIPLSQDRWFGYAGEQNDNGVYYRALVRQIRNIATEKETYIWLDLHWNNLNIWGQNIGQHKMPDENSITFWQSVVTEYQNDATILFGLYNEPHDTNWDIWLNGGEESENVDVNGTTQTITYNAIGHQRLYNEIRAMGAENIIIAAGLDWGYDLSGILNGYAIDGYNIAYDTHPYPWKNENWDHYWGDIGKQYPIIVGEWGGDETNSSYFTKLTYYLYKNKFNWAAWCFHRDAGPQMLEDWDYSPTYFGSVVYKELMKDIP